MCDDRLWSKLIPYLSKYYELKFIKIPQEKNLDDIADKIAREIGDEQINLFGFSLGGHIASLIAVKYPNRVKKLFIAACSSCDLPNDEITTREESISFTKKFGFKGLSSKKVKSLLDKSNQNNQVLIKLIQSMYKDLGEDTFLSQIRATLRREDLINKLSKLNIPITFFYSKKDILVDNNWLNKFKKISLNGDLIEIEGMSHMLPLEKVEELSSEIINWAKK
jgi:pimeloyl-ACP methyl ester carboxylesterase